MKRSTFCVAILSAAIAGSVFAHGAYTRFGGVLAEVDDMYFELVNKNGSGTIYVTEDHESEVSTKGDAKLVAGAKVEATITFADKKIIKVRFVSK